MNFQKSAWLLAALGFLGIGNSSIYGDCPDNAVVEIQPWVIICNGVTSASTGIKYVVCLIAVIRTILI